MKRKTARRIFRRAIIVLAFAMPAAIMASRPAMAEDIARVVLHGTGSLVSDGNRYGCFTLRPPMDKVMQPARNVRDVGAVFSRSVDGQGSILVTVAFHFHDHSETFKADGVCDPKPDGTYGCSLFCGGGEMILDAVEKGAVALSIPEDIVLYDPEAKPGPMAGQSHPDFAAQDRKLDLVSRNVSDCSYFFSMPGR